MKKCVIYSEDEFNQLPISIINSIVEIAAEKYGCKFISRETGKELEPLAVVGLFTSRVKHVLNYGA